MSEFTIEPSRSSGFDVYGWSVYPQHSVLAGQNCKRFMGSFETLPEAVAAHPDAEVMGWRVDAGNSYNHLPSEDDPVAGGMYPDDWDDGY